MGMREDTSRRSSVKLTMTAFYENEQNKRGDEAIKAVQQVLKATKYDKSTLR